MHNFTESLTICILGRMVDRIAEQVRALSRKPITISDWSFVNGLTNTGRIPAMFASDRLDTGEPIGRQLGTLLRDPLNREEMPRPAARASAASKEKPTVNNFGGISIHVREASDVNTVVRDLRFQGLQLLNRRG